MNVEQQKVAVHSSAQPNQDPLDAMYSDLVEGIKLNLKAWSQPRFYLFMIDSIKFLMNDVMYAKYLACLGSNQKRVERLGALYGRLTRKIYKKHRKEVLDLFDWNTFEVSSSLLLKLTKMVQEQSARYNIKKTRYKLVETMYKQLIQLTNLSADQQATELKNGVVQFNQFMQIRSGMLKAKMSGCTSCLNCFFPYCRG